MADTPFVEVRRELFEFPTYEPQRPDVNPMFLEKRVYQGSSGKVYPLPFVDRIAEEAKLRSWEAVFIENEYVRVMLLPQLGGRIHRIQDKTNGYDVIYYQSVIKPALVGLAGPWCSGGIEFNWPQHHRPSTFMPAEVAVEREEDGSATVWMSEHDPMARMKGMHGVRLRPGRSLVELCVRAYNRTVQVQTFLWWANVATRVHEAYQSFFPPDTRYVADHAKRATSTFPLCDGHYYGVDYAARGRDGISSAEIPRQFVPPHCRSASPNDSGQPGTPFFRPDDLSWYANIPVPTSYMCMGSSEDFCGGYDYKAESGIIHVANHHISPGKKQWTWGNHEFGYAWDRNLTDPDPATGEYAPYIELMAGVYADNQPDFSFMQPGETRTWRQYWYPIQRIGPAHAANVEAALRFQIEGHRAKLGLATTATHSGVIVRLDGAGKRIAQWSTDVMPDRPFQQECVVDPKLSASDCTVIVDTSAGRELIRYTPRTMDRNDVPSPASAPPAPADVASTDELYVIGLHLEQYRHATRLPEAYWSEALRRDPGDARCNLGLGRWHLRRGEFALAENHLRASIARLTSRNPNPYDGEPYYQLGLCLQQQAFAAASAAPLKIENQKLSDAYAAFYKATWNHAWQGAAYHALAEIDALRGHWETALDHLARALRVNSDNLRARNLQVVSLRRLDRVSEANAILEGTLALDPLDAWARVLAGGALNFDHQVRLDLAHDQVRAGLFREAIALLDGAGATEKLIPKGRIHLADGSLGTEPLLHYTRAWIAHLAGDTSAAQRHLVTAAQASPDYCFPARLEEIAIFEYAIAENPDDARAPFFLGNLLYDRRRHDDAIRLWERATKREPTNAVAWRNLGVGYFNVQKRAAKARAAYERAFHANRGDARLLYERDQLWKRLGESPQKRLKELSKYPQLVAARDDLSVEQCALFNQIGRPEAALPMVASRKFQPWEGGEGQAFGQHVRTHQALGRRALAAGDAAVARAHFTEALSAPHNLGEASHLLANRSDLFFWLGCACAAGNDEGSARQNWTTAAEARGDFQEMKVRAFSEMTYYSALALERLGRKSAARKLLRDLLAHAQALARTPAKIDYFATSLPTMLLFEDDLQARRKIDGLFLEAQARLGLGQTTAARKLLREVLRRDPNHSRAADLCSAPNRASKSKPKRRVRADQSESARKTRPATGGEPQRKTSIRHGVSGLARTRNTPRPGGRRSSP